jgi:hypothetical protein
MEIPRQTVVDALRRAGKTDLAELAIVSLPDPVDQHVVESFFAPYGLNRERLVDLMGGSL